MRQQAQKKRKSPGDNIKEEAKRLAKEKVLTGINGAGVN